MAGAGFYLSNPFKRIWAALTSGNRAAYINLLYIALSPITRSVDRIISLFTNIDKKNNLKLIVILSPPRSGSTIVYQYLSKHLDCTCITNINYLFPISGDNIKKYIYNKQLFKNSNLYNYYGYTHGLQGSNDGNYIFSNSSDIDIINKLGYAGRDSKYLLVKNVYLFDKVQFFLENFDNVKFIYLKRDLVQNARSVYCAQKSLGISKKIISQIGPSINTHDPYRYSIELIINIRDTIENSIYEIDNDRYQIIRYEDFCKNPKKEIVKITKWLNINVNNIEDIEQLVVSEKYNKDADIIAELYEEYYK